MPTTRKIVFRNDYYYHVFNRGVARMPIFNTKREYERALSSIRFDQYSSEIRFSHFLNKKAEEQITILRNMREKLVDIIAYCLMPNHFHFLLKQTKDNGISEFISRFTNSYTKYFNTKNDRVGPLFQGIFKAVYIETDEQLVHLSRYIHLNPVASSIINSADLDAYAYSSYRSYIHDFDDGITNNKFVLSLFSSKDHYQLFVNDHIKYAQELDQIKHLTLDC